MIASRSGAYPLAFFAAMMLLQFVVVLLFFSETKRVSLEGLQHMLKIESCDLQRAKIYGD